VAIDGGPALTKNRYLRLPHSDNMTDGSWTCLKALKSAKRSENQARVCTIGTGTSIASHRAA
jgi:hypothetical protein